MTRSSKFAKVNFKDTGAAGGTTSRLSHSASKTKYNVDNEDVNIKDNDDERDDEYEEDEDEDEDEEEEHDDDVEVDDDDDDDDEDEDEDDDGEGDDGDGGQNSKVRDRRNEEEAKDNNNTAAMADSSKASKSEGTAKRSREPPARVADNIPIRPTPTRGRPPKRKFARSSSPDQSKAGFTTSIPSNSKRPRLPYPVDDNGDPLPVVNDEYTLPDDPEGEGKITKEGDLLGGRQFLVRTFTLTGRGQIKYMLSTEPARALVISQDDRNDLIDRGVIPYSYRSRAIALVTARSVFKEFGAKIIVDGKNITDDYYATTLRAEGRVVEGTYAREPLPKVGGRNGEGVDFTMSNVNPARNAVEFFDKKNHNIAPGSNISATNWLYQHAAACSRFNSDLFYDRERVLLIENLGLRDPYTNTLHLPQSTQSTQVLEYKRIKPESDDIVFSTCIRDHDVARRKCGLANVPLELFDGIVSDEVKQAILEQREFERAK